MISWPASAVGRIVETHHSLPSTNDRAKELLRLGAPHGMAVVADEQTLGRGQGGRHWVSTHGHGLYVSFLLHPTLPASALSLLPLAAGLALRDMLVAHGISVPVQLKWPNDVLVAESLHASFAKIAGILTETVRVGDRTAAVVGMGVNVLQAPNVGQPTSCVAEWTSVVSPRDLLPDLCRSLEHRLAQLQERPFSVPASFAEHAWALGQKVVVQEALGGPPSSGLRGNLDGLATDGALLVRDPEGHQKAVYSGRLRLQKPV